MVDIVVVKTDPIIDLPTLRDQKIINSLKKRFPVIVLGWDRENKINKSSAEDYLKLFHFKAPYGYESRGLFFPAYLVLFWAWAFSKLCIYRPKIVHACNFDSVLPSYIYKILFRKKLVFDVFDRYAMAYIPRNRGFFHRLLYSFANWFEEEFAKNCDVLINVSDEMLETYRKRPKNCVTIMNCSDDYLFNRLKPEKNDFTILFTGHLRPGRGLEVLPDIVRKLTGTKLIVTGRVEDKKLLDKIQGISNITYLGFLDHADVLRLESNSDAMIALYDLDLQTQNKFVMGNKLFESMMCGKPIISNVAQELIKGVDCGIVVDYKNAEQIKDAIVTLRDNVELRKRLGNNGRQAFLEKYNWKNMEQRLYKVYSFLLNE